MMPGKIHITIKSNMGSKLPEVAMLEYIAPLRSKNKPAYAHSFTLRGKPGISITIDPIILAMLIYCIK
jgi:hypothetical protein